MSTLAEHSPIKQSMPELPLPEMASDGEFNNPYSPERLEPFQPTEIDTSVSLFDPNDVKETLGFAASVPAVIEAGDKRLMLVDLRQIKTDKNGHRNVAIDGESVIINADFLLVGTDEWDLGRNAGYKGIRSGEPVVFGRSPQHGLRDRFNFSEDVVSRDHFKIEYSEGTKLAITDLNSTNGTEITRADHMAQAGSTMRAVNRHRAEPGYQDPDLEGIYGYVDGYPIIGRDSDSIKGIYLGGGAREAILVDPNNDPRLDAVYKSLQKRSMLKSLMKRVIGSNYDDVEGQLEIVKSAVQSVMKYDRNTVDQFTRQFYGDKKVYLGEFIDRGIGVCRHQGLLAAYLIERLINDGKLQGLARVERNTIPEYGGTHAWAAFTTKDGNQYVVDPAQSFVGSKKAARKQNRWDYYLPLSV